MWDLRWITQHRNSFSPSTSVSPIKYSTDCSTLINIYHLVAGLTGQKVDGMPRAVSLTPIQQTKEQKTLATSKKITQ
jgi:hypothetical protein